MNILDEIIIRKKKEVAVRKKSTPLFKLKSSGADGYDFLSALRKKPMGFIAEIKRKSPSAGVIRSPFDLQAVARSYADHGATAISCLIDEFYFGGGEKDFKLVREVVNLPMLYKEFVIDEWQISHAKFLGASAVLLIVSALDKYELSNLMDCINEHNLTALVEVHNQKEMDQALEIGAECIGINNRNLKTFQVSLDVTINLLENYSEDIVVVSESGIKSSDDVYKLKEAGVDALLVGERLLANSDPGLAIQHLLCKI